LQNPQPHGKKKPSTKGSGQTAQQLEQAGELLKQITAATGGRAYFPSSAKEFNSVYAEIAQIIRHEYSLAFAPTVRDGTVHSIEIRMDASQTQAPKKQTASYHIDYRQAYVAPAHQ